MNGLFRLMQSAMSLDDQTWARHANPWSVYSRMTILPLFALAAWSRIWIGWWALVIVALCIAWTWMNPRLFPPPKRMDSWAARGTLGERIFIDRENRVATHHRLAVGILTAANVVGSVIFLWGLVSLEPWVTLWGLTTAMGAKLWTFDRMVWLYCEMREPDGNSDT